jgi:hypothetical protein
MFIFDCWAWKRLEGVTHQHGLASGDALNGNKNDQKEDGEDSEALCGASLYDGEELACQDRL